jgi:uncharacterized protein YbjQ (UPF0145 family)
MKNQWLFSSVVALSFSVAATHALARNDIENYSIQDALAQAGDTKLADDIGLYFAGQPHGETLKQFGEIATNKKTNAAGRSDEAACQHVFLSALIALQDRARRDGGNAVINIKSNYKNRLHESATEFTCGAGAFIAGVALKGDVVTLKK